MTYILLVGGIKGGVGKTLVCRACIEYLNQQGFSTIAVDSDREIRDVSEFYKSELIGFLEDFRKVMEPDKILEIAEQSPDYIVVNLPGNTHQPLQEWLISTSSIQSRKAPDNQPQFIQFFVTDGCWSSIQLFLKSVSEHSGKLPHVLIRNSGRLMSSADWGYLDAVCEYREALENNCVLVADFPLVATPVLFELDRQHLTFQGAVEGSSSLLARRTGFFVNQYTQMFDRIFEQLSGLVDGNLKPAKRTRKKVTIEDLASQLNKDLAVVTNAIASLRSPCFANAQSNNPQELATNLSVSEESLGITPDQYQKLKDKIPAEKAV